MAKRKKKQIRKVRFTAPDKCVFDVAGTAPSYKNHEELAKFLTDRGKIIGKDRSGVCSTHQRQLSKEIKRARHLGLLPFAPAA